MVAAQFAGEFLGGFVRGQAQWSRLRTITHISYRHQAILGVSGLAFNRSGCGQVALQDWRRLFATEGLVWCWLMPHFDWLIKRVPLHWYAPRLANGFDHLTFGLQLRRFRPSHV